MSAAACETIQSVVTIKKRLKYVRPGMWVLPTDMSHPRKGHVKICRPVKSRVPEPGSVSAWWRLAARKQVCRWAEASVLVRPRQTSFLGRCDYNDVAK
jgi:hypothetical protein